MTPRLPVGLAACLALIAALVVPIAAGPAPVGEHTHDHVIDDAAHERRFDARTPDALNACRAFADRMRIVVAIAGEKSRMLDIDNRQSRRKAIRAGSL